MEIGLPDAEDAKVSQRSQKNIHRMKNGFFCELCAHLRPLRPEVRIQRLPTP